MDYSDGASFGIESSLGSGEGTTDNEFRSATMHIDAEVSRMAPFDRYQIDQSYLYEQGRLEETVQLLDGEQPWVRIEERAALFAPQSFDMPPTRLAASARSSRQRGCWMERDHGVSPTADVARRH